MFKLIIASCVFLSFNACAQPDKKMQHKGTENVSAAIIVSDTNWTEKVVKTNAEWKKILTSEQYNIMREHGTERPFTHEFKDIHEKGIFYCVACNNPLFAYETKFNSGTGWPSFYQPFSSRSLDVSTDNSLGMVRDEVSCKKCGGHLGHVFDDGPNPTGLRYCIDGVALKFMPGDLPKKQQVATFAGGCFWCEETIFEGIRGVSEVISGYSGGKEPNPDYESVGAGQTGHAEAFEVYYDSTQISYTDLVRVFFASIDASQLNGQGPDRGRQYRTIAFYRNDQEKTIIENAIREIEKSGQYSKPVATEVVPYDFFVQAEDYHQNYVSLHPENPYVQHESIPRRERTFKQVKDLLKK